MIEIGRYFGNRHRLIVSLISLAGLTGCSIGDEGSSSDSRTEAQLPQIESQCDAVSSEEWTDVPIGRNTPLYAELLGTTNEALLEMGTYGPAHCDTALDTHKILSSDPPLVSVAEIGSRCVAMGYPYAVPQPETTNNIYATCLSKL